MAILKVVNKIGKSHAALRSVIRYVLDPEKTEEALSHVTGMWDYKTSISPNNVMKMYLEDKKYFKKDSGRMYAHTVISFHEKEKITPKQALEFGKEWVEKKYPEHQSLITVHRDKGHLHVHIITNSVGYTNGQKLHQTKLDLQRSKELCNEMCISRGLSVARKGYHFDGTPIEVGDVTAWDKNTYNLLKNSSQKSFLVECGQAVLVALTVARNRETFIGEMLKQGWTTIWKETKKHIVFEKDGNKVRGTNLLKKFHIDATKEGLENEFKRYEPEFGRSEDEREREREIESYYSQMEEIIGRSDDRAGEAADRENGSTESDSMSVERIREVVEREREAEERKRKAEKDRRRRDREDEDRYYSHSR